MHVSFALHELEARVSRGKYANKIVHVSEVLFYSAGLWKYHISPLA